MSKKSLKKQTLVSTAWREMDVANPITQTFRVDQIKDYIQEFSPEFVTVLGMYRVQSGVYLNAAKSLEEISECLIEGEEYWAESLVGERRWAQFPPNTERQFELCFLHFSHMKDCPLDDTFHGSFKWGKKGACI